MVELLLYLAAQSVHGSHLGKLQAIFHVLKRALEQGIESSKYDHYCTILASSETNIVPELPPGSSHDLTLRANL